MHADLNMTTSATRRRRPVGWSTVAALMVVSIAAAACGSSTASGSKSGSGSTETSAKEITVKISLTPAGCKPNPSKIAAGHVTFDVKNANADAVSEAELRSKDLSHILGEQENLTPGLSGGFSLNLQPGSYVMNCPGASKQHWPLTVTGSATEVKADPTLTAAVSGYAAYINQNVAQLITSTQAFCAAIAAGNIDQAKLLYSPARIYYERIEPVAEIWGSLDTSIDGRWENPVTDPAKFTGFHKIEQLLWEGNTLAGASDQCTGLVQNEQKLQQLVSTATYTPLEMAAGATDLVNEAGTAKITGEEERYSNVDLPTFKANIDGAMEVVTLLTPYLQKDNGATLSLIAKRNDAVTAALQPLQQTPGYLNTGYVEYTAVLDAQRKTLSSAVNALAEALSKLSSEVS